jgi:multiple sugar transport system permease protein
MATVDTPVAARMPEPRRRKGRRASRFTPGIIGSYGLTTLYALTLLVPLYWLVISAFKPTLDILEKPFLPSFSAGWTNFTQVWSQLDMAHAMASSFYITAAALVLTLVLALPAAYGLARSGGTPARWTERLFALGFLIPGFAALIPTLLLAIKLNLFNTREFIILWLPASAQPLAVILLTQFMRTVPAELEESARIDGAGRFRVLWSIYLPLTMAGIATVSILNFISFWNEYLFTFIITGTNPAVRTVQVALPTLQGNRGVTDYALVTAATTIAVLPVFAVYAVLNRRMENALVQGALKG